MPSVLIVDDEPSLRTTVSMLLRMEGFDVRMAHDGRQGLEMALAQPPDVILSDLHMPHMSGTELLCAVRQAAALADTRVVLLTGAAGQALAHTGSGPLPDAVLAKPFSRDQLLAVLATLQR